MRYRHRQRLEISVYGGSGRRRCLRAVLSALPRHSGLTHHDHGICSGPRQPQESGARLSGAGKAGPEVAHPRLFYPHRVLSADDVLHHRCGLDAALFLHDGGREAVRPEHRAGDECLRRDAGRPRRHGVLDDLRGRVRHSGLRQGSSSWSSSRSTVCSCPARRRA